MNSKSNGELLIVENEDRDCQEMLDCLPGYISLEEDITIKKSVDESYILALKKGDYKLCICDVLEIKAIENGVPLNSDKVAAAFEKGIKRNIKLYNQLGCNLIIVTKLPVVNLLYHFKKMKNNKDVEGLFGTECTRLFRKLKANKNLLYGTIYKSEDENVYIFLKPSPAQATSKTDKKDWVREFRDLINKNLT